jgi:two-component system sensor histidine kinase and response regulator WspE
MTEAEADPLLDLFYAELREQVVSLGRGLLELERVPDDPAPVEAVVQAAHAIRGAARIIHQEVPARLAAGLEDLFAAALAERPLTPADVALGVRVTDALSALGETEPATWAEERAAEIAELNEALTIALHPPAVDGIGAAATKSTASVGSGPLFSPSGSPSNGGPEPSPPAPPPPAGLAIMADPVLLELFREEARSHAAALGAGLLELEREPNNPQRVEPLMRAAHSLKGAARIVGLDPAVKLAHVMEDAFVAAQAGRIRLSPGDVDLFLRCADLLSELGDGDPAGWAASRHTQAAELATAVGSVSAGNAAPLTSPRGRERAHPEAAKHSTTQASDTTNTPAAPAMAVAASTTMPTESVVRVTAQSLNRLMSLAGESLVQARWLQPFAAALLQLKKYQDHLTNQLDSVAQKLSADSRPESLAVPVAEARRQAASCRQALAERIAEFDDHAGRAEDLNTRLYREVIVSRMRPFADGAGGFPRLVRDTARTLGKSARLEIDGATTEVDRDILEKLEAPLTHLLRNAVDHGLEMPDARSAAGKPAEGAVRVEARHRAGMLAITVSDDGAGIDLESIRRKVIDRRHATAEMAARLSEAELLEFLFLPGFSTAGQVTEVSGRGVGLDVVQDIVRKVGGSVHISTRPGLGTTFHLLLPITLSVLRAVLVNIAGEPYAFPHNRIDRLLRVPHAEVRSLEHRQFVIVDGRSVGLVLAAQLLDLPSEPPAGDDLPVLLLSDATGTYGLIVESIRGEQDLVVRPLDSRLGKVPNVSAAALLDDGAPVLIADVEDMIRSMDQFIQSGTLRRCDRSEAGPTAKKRVLVVDDSITVREVQRQILRTHGYEVEVAVDGQDGWNTLRAGPFDLVISDVDMPRLNGLDFVRRIRDDHALRELPVIIVSYKDRDEDRLRGLEAGANHYLTKSSFHDHTFLDAVAALIGRA